MEIFILSFQKFKLLGEDHKPVAGYQTLPFALSIAALNGVFERNRTYDAFHFSEL